MKRTDKSVEPILEKLQQYVLDNEIPQDTAGILDEIDSTIAEARETGETELENTMEQVRVVLSGRSPGAQELLPYLFAVQDLLQTVTVTFDNQLDNETPEKPPLVQWDVPGDMEDLGALDEQARFLLTGALSRGLTPYLIRLIVPANEGFLPGLAEALENRLSVVVIRTDEREARVSALVVETAEPSLEEMLKEFGSEFGTETTVAPDYSVREITREELDRELSESRPWYQELPPVEIRIASSSLDRIRFLIGRLEESLEEDQKALVRELTRTLDRAVSVRMKDLVDGLKPALEEIAESMGKPVHISFGGTAETIPAEMGEILRGALLELLTNAVRHGIENPAERQAAGKAQNGQIRIFAALDDTTLTIRVTDDGCGIEEKRIRNALKKGHSSGGLAGIHRNVQRLLGGGITLKSGRRGSTVTITVPATAGGWSALLCRRRERPFVVPSVLVTAVMPVRASDLVEDPSGGRFLRFRERILPLVEAQAGSVQSTPGFALVLTMHTGEFALALDEQPREAVVVPDGPGTVRVPDAGIERVRVAVITSEKKSEAHRNEREA